MRRQHHVIYVPGILDDIYHQGWAMKAWRVYGVHGHLHEMPWAGQEPYQPKLQRLLELIDDHKAKGHIVSLFAVSAGASAVLNAYVERKNDIASVVYAVAKIQAPETVGDRVYASNPAFRTSMDALQDNIKKLTPADKAKMHSFYSPADGYVPHEATVIPGVREDRLPALRHGWAITYCLTLGAPAITRRIKAISDRADAA